jgi:hypothetical protein
MRMLFSVKHAILANYKPPFLWLATTSKGLANPLTPFLAYRCKPMG